MATTTAGGTHRHVVPTVYLVPPPLVTARLSAKHYAGLAQDVMGGGLTVSSGHDGDQTGKSDQSDQSVDGDNGDKSHDLSCG